MQKCFLSGGCLMYVLGFAGYAADDGIAIGGNEHLGLTKAPTRLKANCSVSAYVSDPDPAGLNVRAGPGAKHEVLGVLFNEDPGTIIHIVQSRAGWMRFDKILLDPFAGQPGKKPPAEGWVSGKQLSVDPQVDDGGVTGLEGDEFYLYARPDDQAKKLRKLAHEDMKIVLLDCKGRWLKVRVKLKRGPVHEGWMNPVNQCDSPVTTCPFGNSGD